MSAQIDLAARLMGRSEEAEDRITLAISALPETQEPPTPNYARGLRAAISESVEFTLGAIDVTGPEQIDPVAVAAQARRAARTEVPLDTVLRRIAAGDQILSGILAEEASGVPRATLRDARRTMSEAVDKLMALVANEYSAELSIIRDSPKDELLLQTRSILSGGDQARSVGDYRFDGWHVGLASLATLPERALIDVAHGGGYALLVVSDDLHGQTWAWLGRSSKFSASDLQGPLTNLAADGRPIMVGEAHLGLDGWRLSHEEAMSAVESPMDAHQGVLRCRDALLSVAVLRDPILTRALISSYIEPLDQPAARAGGDLRRTLRAYLAAGQNTTTAAALLSVNRHTVQRRVRIAEKLLGQRIEDCHAELGVALQIDCFGPSENGPATGRTGSIRFSLESPALVEATS